MTDAADSLYAALHGLAAILIAVLLTGLVRRRDDDWQTIVIALVFAIAGPVVIFATLAPRDIPIDLVTVMHEGTELQSLRQLYAAGVHAGPSFSWLTRLCARGSAPDLREVVLLNLSLLPIWASGVLVMARHVTRSWLAAIPLTLASLLCYPTALAALSELPAAVLAVYLLAGVVAASCIDDRDRATRRTDAIALSLLAIVSFLAFATREETLLVSAPALVVAAARVGLGDRALARRERRVLDALATLVRGGRARLVLVLALTLASVGLFRLFAHDNGRLGWIVEALHPLNPTTLTLVPHAAFMLVPTSTLVLFVLGLIHSTRHWRTFLAFPLTLLAVYRLYNAAAHDTAFEILRYLTLLTPGLILISLFGVHELAHIAAWRNWPDGWRLIAVFALTLAFAATTAFADLAWFGWDPAPQDAPTYRGFPLDRDVQREVRYLLVLRDRFPECVFVAPVTARGSGNVRERDEYVAALFGAGRDVPQTFALEPDLTLADLARRETPDAPCVLAFVGLDCNLEDGDDCSRFVSGALVDERTFTSAPYNDDHEYGRHRSPIRLALYELEGP